MCTQCEYEQERDWEELSRLREENRQLRVKRMNIPQWLVKIAMYCDICKESGAAWMKFNKALASGDIPKEEWMDEIKRSWFILSDENRVVFHGFSQWECVEQNIPGEIINASTHINLVLKGLAHKPGWGYPGWEYYE